MSKNKIEYFDSIETCPFKRWQKFNKYLSLASEVGDSPSDMFTRIDRASGYIGAKNNDAAIKELSNLKLTIWNAIQEYSPKGTALAVMVKSINGVECNDITTKGLNDTLNKLNELGVTIGDIKEDSNKLKKKSLKNLGYTLVKRLKVLMYRLMQLGLKLLKRS